MIRLEGEVIDSDARGSLVLLDADTQCEGCRGCGMRSRANAVRLPGHHGRAVAVSLTTTALLAVLSHSLFLPLAGFVSGALVASIAEAGDIAALAASAAGLLIGLALCRRQPEDSIQIQEVHHG